MRKLIVLLSIVIFLLASLPQSRLAIASSLQIADSTTAEGVDPSTYQPINRTQTFTAIDYAAYSWIKFVNVVSPSHNVTWVWSTPHGSVYWKLNSTIPDPGAGQSYAQYYLYSDVYVHGAPAAALFGTWQVAIYTDGTLALVQKFAMTPRILTPLSIRTAYDVTPIIQAGYTGTGVTVAVVNKGIDSTFYDDIQGFGRTYGLPDFNISVVKPYGSQGTDSETPAGETTADVEFVHAMAPNARVLLVLVGQGSMLDGFSYVIDNNAADIATVSPSWAYWGQGARDRVNFYNAEYAKSLAKNITLIAASNDWGSNNTVPWGTITGDFWTQHLPDSYLMPQYSPYVTAVGGTEMALKASQVSFEIGWNQSGGGPSNLFQQPSWQSGPGVPNNGYRDIPDLALDASCLTPYAFFWQNHLGYFCGTSAGAPIFAGIIADIIQAAGHRVGLLNPTLYSIASSDSSAFRDITSGCSMVKVGSTNNVGYCASKGWDYVTGLGAPDSARLLRYIAPQAQLVSTSTSKATTSASVTSSASSVSTVVTSTTPEFPAYVLAVVLSAALAIASVAYRANKKM